MTSHPQRKGMFLLETEVEVARPLRDVFAFFADATRLETITPPWLQFKVLTPSPIEMREGTEIEYQLRIHKVPLRWKSLISVWEPGVRFVDEQIRGPYRRWHHEHRFEATSGGTLVSDRVQYSVPGGKLIHSLFVRRDLEEIFSYRTRVLKSVLESNKSAISDDLRS